MDLAIVVAGYSRLDSVKRITSSIFSAFYCKENITLYYSLDYSDNQDSIIKYINTIKLYNKVFIYKDVISSFKTT